MEYFLTAFLCLLLVTPMTQAQQDTTRAAGKTKPPAAAAAAAPKATGAALLSEPRDTSDHADNRGDEYFQGTYDNNPNADGGDQDQERNDEENQRQEGMPPVQGDQGSGGGQE